MLANARRLARKLAEPQGSLPPGVQVGEGVFIGDQVVLDAAAGRAIRIDADATLADQCTLLCHDASSNRRLHATWVAPVHICERAFIGYRALILPGVTVGADAVVAAYAVVSKDVPPGAVVAGVPARVVGTVADLDERRRAAMQTHRTFDSNVYDPSYNPEPLPPEMEADIRAAAEGDGGYFLTP